MRLFLFNIMLVFLLFSCGKAEHSGNDSTIHNEANANGMPKIEFKETSHDFGRVYQGEKVGWYFTYKNTGNAPLIIKRARASCGCTVPEYDKKPLSPGDESKLKVIYDSRGRSGKDFKTVTLETNAENNIIKLELEVEVLTE